MPLIDMPLEELKKYPGRNPRPADFDRFWAHGLAEMKEVDPQVQVTPVENPAKFADCFDLRFTGVGGARIYAKFIRPKGMEGPIPAVVMFHGYSMSSGEWHDKLCYAANGMAVFAMDCRGQGGLSEDVGGVRGNTLNGHIIRGLADSPEKLYYRQVFLDAAQLAGIAMSMPEIDASRVGATGWSQGGGITLACAGLEPRISRAAPVYPFLCDYRRVWEMDLARSAYDEIAQYFRKFDPLHAKESEVFDRLGYIDAQHHAPQIRAEVLMTTGLMDTICPPSTQFAAFNKIPGKKSVDIMPDFTHEGLPGVSDRVFAFMSEL